MEANWTRRRRAGRTALVVLVALVAGACSADDAESTTTLTTPSTTTEQTTTTLPATTSSPTTTAVPSTTTTTAAPTLAEPDICAVPSACPDFTTALAGDDGDGPLPLGTVDDLPNEDRLDFLFRLCFDECFLDAHFLDPENPEFGEGPWTAGRAFHVRHGFINSGSEPLGEGFNVALYVSRQPAFDDDPPEVTEAEAAGFELGEVYKFTADYVLQDASDRCGPTFESQTGSETCEWFVYDFPDGLPDGRFTIWSIWEAPCSAWSDLGLTESCEDPDEVISKFSSTVNSPFGDFPPEYIEERN